MPASPRNDERAMRRLLEQLCEPYELRRFAWDGGVPVDFAHDPVNDILIAYVDWIEDAVRDLLRRQGYSEYEIGHFEERRELATSVRDEDLGPLDLCVIYAADALAHRREDMLLVDMFILLRTARYFSERRDFPNVMRYLRILIKQTKAHNQVVADPQRKGTTGGVTSGKSRRAGRARIVEDAAKGLLALRQKNWVKNHGLNDIETAAGLEPGTLRKRKISHQEIKWAAIELRRKRSSKL